MQIVDRIMCTRPLTECVAAYYIDTPYGYGMVSVSPVALRAARDYWYEQQGGGRWVLGGLGCVQGEQQVHTVCS